MHAVVLRIQVQEPAHLAHLTDALGECARELEAHEARATDERSGVTRLGLVPDPDEPGRFAWEIVTESYA
jgi:hypothetical protein